MVIHHLRAVDTFLLFQRVFMEISDKYIEKDTQNATHIYRSQDNLQTESFGSAATPDLIDTMNVERGVLEL
jgi:hypothetical protein